MEVSQVSRATPFLPFLRAPAGAVAAWANHPAPGSLQTEARFPHKTDDAAAATKTASQCVDSPDGVQPAPGRKRMPCDQLKDKCALKEVRAACPATCDACSNRDKIAAGERAASALKQAAAAGQAPKGASRTAAAAQKRWPPQSAWLRSVLSGPEAGVAQLANLLRAAPGFELASRWPQLMAERARQLALASRTTGFDRTADAMSIIFGSARQRRHPVTAFFAARGMASTKVSTAAHMAACHCPACCRVPSASQQTHLRFCHRVFPRALRANFTRRPPS